MPALKRMKFLKNLNVPRGSWVRSTKPMPEEVTNKENVGWADHAT
jgi:hypothetical protein